MEKYTLYIIAVIVSLTTGVRVEAASTYTHSLFHSDSNELSGTIRDRTESGVLFSGSISTCDWEGLDPGRARAKRLQNDAMKKEAELRHQYEAVSGQASMDYGQCKGEARYIYPYPPSPIQSDSNQLSGTFRGRTESGEQFSGSINTHNWEGLNPANHEAVTIYNEAMKELPELRQQYIDSCMSSRGHSVPKRTKSRDRHR